MPPVGAPGVPATDAYGRVQFVLAGIAAPTVTPVHVIAPRCRFVLLPPVAVIDCTTLFGDGDVAFEPDGSVSVSVSRSPRVIGSGPLFVTATVHRIVPPALTVAAPADFATVRS